MGRSNRAAFFIDGAFGSALGQSAIVLKHEMTDLR
jgi:hypothetical protein